MLSVDASKISYVSAKQFKSSRDVTVAYKYKRFGRTSSNTPRPKDVDALFHKNR